MRLLIVEDEPLIAQRLERMCREILGVALESVAHASLPEESAARSQDLRLLRQANFAQIDISTVDRASEPPHFETIMAIAEKPAISGD